MQDPFMDDPRITRNSSLHQLAYMDEVSLLLIVLGESVYVCVYVFYTYDSVG
jgi:hypothetical protein